MNRGFSLIQVSILITLASLVLVACLPSLRNSMALNTATTTRMNAILLSLRQFELINGRLPCPADATLPSGSTLYGQEATGNGAANNCSGGTPSATLVDSTSHVAIGMVPVQTLGLSNDYASDALGRTITYAVDTNATSCFSGTLGGTISVNDNGSSVSAVAALVSHGINGHGAWVPLGGGSGAAVRLNSGSTDSDELTNAHLSSTFTTALPLSGFIRKSPTATFDDLVVYRNPVWNLNTSPIATTSIQPSLTPPANATYIAGQTLGFSLTYSASVTISGTPQLALTLGGLIRYASYVSGSGTNMLNFSYKVQQSDYAPNGIGLNSPVNTASGTVSASCNSFTVPSLSGVVVKKLYAYVTDYNNNRTQIFDASGNYISQFGGGGLLAGLFNHPDQLAVDSSGNAWVTDWGNSRVQQFNSSGTYVSKFGSAGVLNGQFVNPAAIAIDGSGNFWVADSGNNRVEEFNSSGGYLGKFGSSGILNGQFLLPNGLAIDSSGNIWVTDSGNDRVEEFSSSGGYLGKFGSLGSGTGQFIGPCGATFDGSGNLWVVDSGNARVEKFDSNGNYLGRFGSLGGGNGQFLVPCGIAADQAGNIWVADGGNNRVQIFSSSGTYQGQFGSFGTGNGQFWTPAGVAFYYQ